jgi:hypothetical protein
MLLLQLGSRLLFGMAEEPLNVLWCLNMCWLWAVLAMGQPSYPAAMPEHAYRHPICAWVLPVECAHSAAWLLSTHTMFTPSAPAGHYWGSVSTGCTCESVEASDLVLAVGCAWTDYSTLGYSLLLQPGKVVTVGTDRVTIKGGETYDCIDMEVRFDHCVFGSNNTVLSWATTVRFWQAACDCCCSSLAKL